MTVYAEPRVEEDGPLASARKGTVRFAGLILDLDACSLRRESGETIPLTRLELAALRVFISRPGRVVSRDALLNAVAARRHEPFDRSVDALVGRLRRKIELNPKKPRNVVTVPGDGYRFDGLTKTFQPAPVGSAGIANAAAIDPPMMVERPDKPTKDVIGADAGIRGPAPPRLSIVVLPFANMSGDAEQEHFVDGVTDSLTTDLSRIRGMVVIARNTAFTYKGKPVDAKSIGRELNSRYVLEGSVQRAGARLRVNDQLIDAEMGSHLWAERFDKPLADFFDMQDEIVARLANALSAHLVAAEARRAEQAPNPDSTDLYFQGLAWLSKGSTADYMAQARGFFDRALAADPENVDALIGLAFVNVREGANSFVTDPVAAFAAAEAKLTKALASFPDHARGHALLGYVEIVTKRAADGIAECEHALALDRNLAHAHAFIGLGKTYSGRPEETEAHIAEALRLSPRDTTAYIWMTNAGLAKLHLGGYKQAVGWYRRAIETNRNYPVAYFRLAAALAQLGRLAEAHSAVKVGHELNPSFTVSRARANWTERSDNPTYLAGLEPILEGLRKAGAPE